jgi:polyphenol oxidase
MEFAKDKLEWLEYDLLKPFSHIKQATFLRHGGTSEGNFSSLNLGKAVGDHPDHVKVNRDLVRDAIELPVIIYPNQVHGTDVVEITPDNVHKLHQADALFTKMENVGLGVVHADCQAVMIYDPTKEVIGIAHAGWKGIVNDIFTPMVEAMISAHECDPKSMIACISPSIGPKHAEYKEYKKEFPEDLWSFQEKENHFNFWAMTQKKLNSLGISDENIECAGICTFEEKNDYFSFRRNKKTGRHATIIGIAL